MTQNQKMQYTYNISQKSFLLLLPFYYFHLVYIDCVYCHYAHEGFQYSFLMIFRKTDFTGSVVGLAGIGVVCSLTSCGVNQVWYLRFMLDSKTNNEYFIILD